MWNTVLRKGAVVVKQVRGDAFSFLNHCLGILDAAGQLYVETYPLAS